MTTVYQVGNLYIAKDMIFGWCVAQDGAHYKPVSGLPCEYVKILSDVQYPAHIPVAYTDELQRHLSKFELEAAIFSASQELKNMRQQVRNLEVGLIRSRDRVSLVSQIMENMIFEEENVWTSDLSPRAMNSILNHYCPNFTMIADEEEQQKSKPTKEIVIKDIYTERLRLATGMGKVTIAELCTYLKIPYPAIKITPAQWRAFNRIMYVHHCPDNTKTVAPAFIEYIETVRPILETEKIWFDIFKDVTNRIAIKMLEVCLEKRPKRGRRYIHAIIGDE